MQILYSKFKAIMMVATIVIVGVCVFGITTTAKAETCTWTASTSQLMSLGANWDDGTGGSSCTMDGTPDTLVFDGNRTSTNAVWDADLIGAMTVTTQNAYTGTITVNATTTATTTALTLNTGTFTNNSESRFWVRDFGPNDGDLTIDSGATYNGTGGLWVDGSISVTGTFSQTGSSTIIYATDDAEIIGTTGNTTFYNLTISSSTSLAGNVTTTNILTINADKTLNAGGYTLTLSGTGTPLVHTSATFNAQGGTVTYSGASAYIASTTFANLNLQGDSTLTGAVTVTNTLALTAGKTLTAGANDLTFTKDTGTPFSAAGATLTAGTGTVTYSGTSASIASTTYYNLTVNNTGTLLANTTVSNILTINADKTLNAGGYTLTLSGTGTPLVHTSATFNAQGGTVVYSGTSANIASTTYGNLTLSTDATLTGNTTVTSTLTLSSGKTLNASSYTLTLSGTGTPFVKTGTFTSSSSTVQYTSTGTVYPATTTYWNLTLGAGTYDITDNTTSTNAFVNGGTLTIDSGKTLSVLGTFDNNGAITETGAIKNPNTSAKITDSSGAEVESFSTTNVHTMYITVVDTDGNLNASSIDTITGGVITATDSSSDSESITLTETDVDTNTFIGSVTFTPFTPKTSSNSTLEVNGSGSLSLAFTDSKDSSDTGSDTATYTGYTLGTGGSSSVGSSNNSNHTTTTTVPQTTTTTTTTTTEATPTPATTTTTDNVTTPGSVETTSPTSSVTTPPTGIVQTDLVSKAKFTKELRYRTTNAGVKTLQTELKKLGYFTYPYLTNFYGNATRAAMIKYQKAKGLKQTGNLDKATMAVLNGSTSVTAKKTPSAPTKYTFTKYLAYGYTGNDVKQLQIRLQELGYLSTTITPNGNFGPATRAAVIKLQKEHELTPPVGFVGPGTRKVLNGK